MAASTFKRLYNYHNIDDTIVVFSVPSRIFKSIHNGGFNTFVACLENDTIVDDNADYRLIACAHFGFHQFKQIHGERDSDNGLRIAPRRTHRCWSIHKLLCFAANFLDCFADIDNSVKFDLHTTHNSVRKIKIYQKIN